ncbi:hypothetical protein Y032_0013g2177 [Ancylostoma ceylanicum]|uniref:Uncharacterized protein n=1 Tax=Ancylostoma ceylanicum TaxID=53326 RepID=A0A016VDT8_9BILA|nr:hypothetical protein Y032_0013g2177 [Ancylostoma ceylanicum]
MDNFPAISCSLCAGSDSTSCFRTALSRVDGRPGSHLPLANLAYQRAAVVLEMSLRTIGGKFSSAQSLRRVRDASRFSMFHALVSFLFVFDPVESCLSQWPTTAPHAMRRDSLLAAFPRPTMINMNETIRCGCRRPSSVDGYWGEACDREILPAMHEPVLPAFFTHIVIYLLVVLVIVLTYFICDRYRSRPPPYKEVIKDAPPPYYLV